MSACINYNGFINYLLYLQFLGVDPDVTFFILVRVFTLSPGLILSGEYPQKKSLLNSNLL